MPLPCLSLPFLTLALPCLALALALPCPCLPTTDYLLELFIRPCFPRVFPRSFYRSHFPLFCWIQNLNSTISNFHQVIFFVIQPCDTESHFFKMSLVFFAIVIGTYISNEFFKVFFSSLSLLPFFLSFFLSFFFLSFFCSFLHLFFLSFFLNRYNFS